MEILHFKSQKERLDYLKGNFEEIVLPKVEEEPKEAEEKAEKTEEKPKKAKKSAKKSKKEDENGESKAE